ncbi:MAG: FHA domain-containing protein [Chitinivibrionales bacterium]|nr:FHA domain-containing protein [Chitinivibrionales bacterium]MBD3356747.1 FHA domain-containing protein [Chitinivibrionales bacterium]
MPTETTDRRFEFPLSGGEVLIGRAHECDMIVGGVGVSRKHAALRLTPEAPVVRDVGSTFGVRVDGKPSPQKILTDGCTLTIGVQSYRVAVEPGKITLERSDVSSEPPILFSRRDSNTVRIGRDTINEIHLPHPLVSRHHCTVVHRGENRFDIADNGSTNGTFVNGRPVRRATLTEGDIVQVGPYRFLFENGKLAKAEDGNRIKLEAFGVTVRRRGHTLLGNISLSIQPGEFVAVLGPSGAGKSTLAQALTGRIPTTEGTVYFSAFPLKQFIAAFRGSIGFVSQQILLRPELTITETFREQALLRLPRDSLPAERDERMREVMDLLDLSRLGSRRIAKISGGEARRVHLGIELLSSPTVVFLDEPLAGLDPGLVHKFMKLFRELADRGHTILLTTHTLEQLELCDRALFINRGTLIYDGPPDKATQAAGVATLAEVYEKARREGKLAGIAVNDEGRDEAKNRDARVEYDKMPSTLKGYRPRSIGHFRQLALLLPRYFRILLRDHRTISLIMVQAPLIALLLALVFEQEGAYLPLSYYFCLTISVIWMGGVNSVREIAREWGHYEREFRAGLSPLGYILSKAVVFSTVGLVQSVLFGLCLAGLFDAITFDWELTLLLWTASTGGSLLGLGVSAFSGSVNQAVTWLPIIFIPQIFFSGILIPFDRMSAAGRILSHLTIARPVFSLFKRSWVLEQALWSGGEWPALGYLSVGLCILAYLRIRLGGIPRNV